MKAKLSDHHKQIPASMEKYIVYHNDYSNRTIWKRHFWAIFILFFLTGLRAAAYNADSATVQPPVLTLSPIAEILQKDISDFNPEEVDKVKTYAIDLWKKIKAEQRILKPLQLTPDKIQDFPVAIGDVDPGTGTVDYAICFDQMVINAQGTATLQAYMVFDPPGGGDKSEPMVFMAKNVTFTATGGISSATLTMLGGFTLVKNDKFEVNILGSESGVVMDCGGFKSFDLAGEVLFNKEMIYAPQDKSSITGKFKLSAASWEDFLVSFTVNSPFEVKGATGYIFTVQSATIDLSNSRNSASFPQEYINETLEYVPAPETWTGFHINEISVQFPKKFTGQNESPTVGLSSLVIDKHGVSVSLFINNLIPIETGNANGWAFSIDQFGLKVLHNQLVAGSLKGKIQLPVMDSPLSYIGIITTDEQYKLSVSTTDPISFDLWKASAVTLDQSRIDLIYEKGNFTASALLTGKMTISAKLSEDANGAVKIPSVNFTNLLLQTKKPYLSVESFGFSDTVGIEFKLAGFKASINEIHVITDNSGETDRVGVGFGVHLSFTNIAKNSFGAEGNLTLFGKMTKDTRGRQKWIYDDMTLNELGIDIDATAFMFKGKLELFKNKPVYGSGFRAELKLTLKKGFEFTVQAMGLFGNTKGDDGKDYPYWQVDALTEFPNPGIPAGALTLIGFGGGAFERMRQDPSGGALGMSLSGVNYVPDKTMGLGIRASVTCTFASKRLVKAKVGLELAFHKEGGLSYISLDGEAEVLPADGDGLGLASIQGNLGNALKSISAKNAILSQIGGNSDVTNINGADLLPKDSTTLMKGIITAKLHIQYLFDSSTFHADLRVNINVYGILTGGGLAQMHFSPKKWYVRVGDPIHPVGVALNLVVLDARLGAYFMMGHDLPAAPDPPAEIARILNTSQKQLSYMRDENSLEAQEGIAFGMNFRVKIDANFLMFYAKLTAGLGFDVMLKEYNNVRCEGSPNEIGINGWYSNGQIYAYVSGSVGIRVKIFRFKKDIEILSLGAASLLQAKFPNPFWMRGIVGGYYSVLGGKIKGQCRFKFEIGNDCIKVQDDPENRSAFEDVEVIGDISPVNGTQEVKVVSPIKANFLTPINTYVDITDEQGNTQWIYVKFREDISLITVKNTGTVIPGKWSISNDKRSMEFASDQPLPAGQEIKVKLVAAFYGTDNKPLLTEQNQPAEEIKSVSFKSDTAALTEIPLENVAYAYPVIEQFNFYKEESGKGFIKLVKFQNDIFENKTNKALLTNGAEQVELTGLSYKDGMITFDIPSALVKLNTNYKFQLLSPSGGKILSYDFRSSQYGSLKDKIQAVLPGGIYSTQVDSASFSNLLEPFDALEIDGKVGMERMVLFEADLTSNTWYNNYIKGFYESVEFKQWIQERPDPYGSPAVKAVTLNQKPSGVTWTGNAPPKVESFSLKYLFPNYIMVDVDNARTFAGGFCECYGRQEECDNFSSPCAYWNYTPLMPGDYKINYKYVLPDKTEGSSRGTLIMQYKK